MGKYVGANSLEDNRFKTIRDFKWCVDSGGEVVFIWNGRTFGIAPKLRKTPSSPLQRLLAQLYIDGTEQTEKWCDTADEVLEYTIDGQHLRDIITKVEVIDRTI